MITERHITAQPGAGVSRTLEKALFKLKAFRPSIKLAPMDIVLPWYDNCCIKESGRFCV